MGRWGACCAWLLVALGGCGHGVHVQASLVEPAAVPVSAYPEVWIAGGFLEEDEIVLVALEQALAEAGEIRVHRVDPSELEPLRRAGHIRPTAVVLLVDVRVEEDVRPAWDTQPVRVCGPYGCETRYEQIPTNVPWVRGTARLRVHEGPSARLLQRHTLSTDLYGGEPGELRLRVAQQLAQRVSDAVRVVERAVEVEWLEVKDPGVSAALARIREGDWQAGRAELERAVRSSAVRALSAEDRARVFYDLGLARRFAPEGGYSERAFDAAARAFQEASRLDPLPRYQVALEQLEAQRRAHARLIAQREAKAHNFALQRGQETLPQPPASYLSPAEPDAAVAPDAQPIPPAPEPAGRAPAGRPVEPVPEEAFEP